MSSVKLQDIGSHFVIRPYLILLFLHRLAFIFPLAMLQLQIPGLLTYLRILFILRLHFPTSYTQHLRVISHVVHFPYFQSTSHHRSSLYIHKDRAICELMFILRYPIIFTVIIYTYVELPNFALSLEPLQKIICASKHRCVIYVISN